MIFVRNVKHCAMLNKSRNQELGINSIEDDIRAYWRRVTRRHVERIPTDPIPYMGP